MEIKTNKNKTKKDSLYKKVWSLSEINVHNLVGALIVIIKDALNDNFIQSTRE